MRHAAAMEQAEKAATAEEQIAAAERLRSLGDDPEAWAKAEELDLGRNAVRDLSPLSGHTALRKLDLSHNDIGDIYPLAGCTGLEELDLSYNHIGYLSHLNTCTALKRLDLTGNSALEADQIRTLQEALPECEIITDIDMSMPEPTPVPPDDWEPDVETEEG